MVFWNIAGIWRQDEEFWKFIGRMDYICLIETWVEEKGWEKIRKKLPGTHRWGCSFAIREKKKGRARGGFIIGVSKDWGEEQLKINSEEMEGLIVTKVKNSDDKLKFIIIGIYATRNWLDLRNKIESITEENKEEYIIIGGDFNARIGEEGGNDEEGWGVTRRSKDKVVNNRGRDFLDLVGEIGGNIINGTTKGDKLGEYTYVGERGSSVIDYVVVSENCRDIVNDLVIVGRPDSDHMPLVLEMKNNIGRKKKKDMKKEEEGEIYRWREEDIVEYKERTEEKEEEEEVITEESIEDKWKVLKELVLKSMVKVKTKGGARKKLGFKEWWNRSCTRRKRLVHRVYDNWRKGKLSRERYIEERRKFREHLEERKRLWKEKEEEELSDLKNEAQVWKVINRKRGRGNWVDNEISKVEWTNHFTKLIGGENEESETEQEDRRGVERRQPGDQVTRDMDDLSEAEIIEALRRLKKGKAAGIDRIPMEAWKFGGSRVKKRLVNLLKEIWQKKEIPEDWKMSVIVTLHKKGDTEKVENYRGIACYARLIRYMQKF
ncbi:uncharacterized protein LOC120359015 [Solenopsis invicta]|uniref:uncharacterized protein LOC120359015 n=1 Tax=Solenopsis invicta TaxID=13686 RepID=UPI00193D7C0A|nr:uncharacterized protein LOC120359015 [Solenopsis invicta]